MVWMAGSLKDRGGGLGADSSESCAAIVDLKEIGGGVVWIGGRASAGRMQKIQVCIHGCVPASRKQGSR